MTIELHKLRPAAGAKRARNALREGADDARLSRDLTTLRLDAPLPFDVNALEPADPDREALRALFTRLGFTRLLQALGPRQVSAAPTRISPSTAPGTSAGG